jgi:SAM-dependent methyltransferase
MKISAIERERFASFIKEAMDASFQGWDFSYMARYGGNVEEPLSWCYVKTVRDYLVNGNVLLDMGTGGGEFLATLQPLPNKTFATEAYSPNVPVAKKILEPLGVTVIEVKEGKQEDYPLPFEDGLFDIIINRHEAYDAKEVYRILQPGGVFITQQVGPRNNESLRMIFGSIEDDVMMWDLTAGQSFLRKAGLSIIEAKEHIGYSRLYDIRALTYLLKVIPWEFPDFNPTNYETQLFNIYLKILENRYFDTTCHRLFMIAQKK